MRKLGLIFILVIGLCSAGWTQGRILSNLFRGKSHPVRTRPAQTNLWLENPSLSSPASGVSVTGYFHRLGNGEKFDMPAWALESEGKRISSLKNKVYKRSLESLELEAASLGLALRNRGTYSRKELEDFIFSYKSYANYVREKVSSRCQFIPTNTREESAELQNWARTQKDYFPENYLDNYMVSHKFYEEPFHPSVKSLRILVVEDQPKYVAPLVSAAEHNPAVTVEWVPSVVKALERLKKDPHAYQAILTDWSLPYYGERYLSTDLSMYIWNEQLRIPVVLYSLDIMSPAFLLRFNIVGRIDKEFIPVSLEDAQSVLNYLSNVVATGRAYPNGRSTPDNP